MRATTRRLTTAAFMVVFGLVGWLIWDRGLVGSLKDHANPFVIFAAMAVLPIIGVPVTPFYVLAGAAFGPLIGLLGSLAALATNLILSFWTAHSGLRPRLIGVMQKTRYSLPKVEQTRDNALRFALMMKLAPGIPLSFKHYAIALAGVPFAVYFAVSFFISGLYLASLVVLGESLLHHEVGRMLVIGAILLFLTLCVTAWQRRQRRRRGSTLAEATT